MNECFPQSRLKLAWLRAAFHRYYIFRIYYEIMSTVRPQNTIRVVSSLLQLKASSKMAVIKLGFTLQAVVSDGPF